MKYILLLFMILCSSTYAQTKKGVIYDATIVRVTDGDTVVFQANFLPLPLKPELSLRIYGIDTPERGTLAKCNDEKQLGQNASNYTRQIIKSAKTVKIMLIEWDKYGGRVLGDVFVDGKSVRELLIENKFPRPYFGGRKPNWCS